VTHNSGTSTANPTTGLRPGMEVVMQGLRYLVIGQLSCVGPDSRWNEFHLQSRQDHIITTVWLATSTDAGETSLTLWTTEDPLGDIQPGDQIIIMDGLPYELGASGQATYTSLGDTGRRAAGTIEYHDYDHPDDTACLAVERFDSGDWRLYLGVPVDPDQITVSAA
jgi:hypothetical protein